MSLSRTYVGDLGQFTIGGVDLELPLVAVSTINRFEEVSETPEPASMLLVGTGLVTVAARRRMRARANYL